MTTEQPDPSELPDDTPPRARMGDGDFDFYEGGRLRPMVIPGINDGSGQQPLVDEEVPQPVVSDATDDNSDPEENGEAYDGPLSPLEQRALLLSAQGIANTVVGEECNRSSKWVQRLRKRPEAEEYLRELHADLLDEIAGGVRMGMVESVAAAREELRGDNSTARMRAVTFFNTAFGPVGIIASQAAQIVDLRRQTAELRATVAGLIEKTQ